MPTDVHSGVHLTVRYQCAFFPCFHRRLAASTRLLGEGESLTMPSSHVVNHRVRAAYIL